MASTLKTDELLTVGEVALLFRVAESTVRKWVAGGIVPFLELPGGDYRIPKKELFRGIRSNLDAVQVLEAVQAKLRTVDEADIKDEVTAARASPRPVNS